MAVPTANDSKPPQPQAQSTAENKSLIRENSHESEKEAEHDRRAPVVSITVYCNMQQDIFSFFSFIFLNIHSIPSFFSRKNIKFMMKIKI